MIARRTWRERFMSGEAEPLDIEDEIDFWHAQVEEYDVFSWLGISRDEYALYFHDLPAFEQRMGELRSAHRAKAEKP